MKLDCNVGRATFTLVDPNNLTVNPILVTTKAACPADTQDAVFSQNLHDAVSYTIADGVLKLTLSNGGTMELTQQP
jgi:heat shock protein HslJ